MTSITTSALYLRRGTRTLLLVGAVLSMGAKWAEQSIHDVKDVAGVWNGSLVSPGGSGGHYSFRLVINEDGSYHLGDNQGTLRLIDGKIQFQASSGYLVALALYERDGKRRMEGRREDGGSLELWPVKKKDKKKK